MQISHVLTLCSQTNKPLKDELKKARAAFKREAQSKAETKARQIAAKQEQDEVASATSDVGVQIGSPVLECQTTEYAGATPCMAEVERPDGRTTQELCWPVLFVYEEHRQRDFIQTLPESSRLLA